MQATKNDFGKFLGSSDINDGIIMMCYLCIHWLYFTVAHAKGSTTVGKSFFNLYVQKEDESDLTYIDSAFRFLMACLTLGYSGSTLIIPFTKRNRAFHDMLSGTVVVQKERKRQKAKMGNHPSSRFITCWGLVI